MDLGPPERRQPSSPCCLECRLLAIPVHERSRLRGR
jgi:hypothetical protein